MSNPKTVGVDIGNTSIKTAEFFDSDIGEIKKWTNLSLVENAYPEALFVVSSVGMRTAEVRSLLKSSLILDTNTALPILLNYQTPDTLGSDRLAAAVGAWRLFPERNILVVDAGTCVTYDLVTSDGVFQGGMISPGLEMRLKAMHQFTNGLPIVKISEEFSEELVGQSTSACILAGARHGLKHEIEGILESFNKKHDRLQVVATGGLSLGFESTANTRIFANSKIVLSGLHAIWKFNEST